jgi:ketosteroid isomerase-like protein
MTQTTIARDEAGIRETMAAYNAALNGGRTAAVLPLYTEDGVFPIELHGPVRSLHIGESFTAVGRGIPAN